MEFVCTLYIPVSPQGMRYLQERNRIAMSRMLKLWFDQVVVGKHMHFHEAISK